MQLTPNEEFNLVERCASGDADAIRGLQLAYRGGVSRFLSERGLTTLEAEEAADELWADLLVVGDRQEARIARYHGHSSLQTWLNAVALNRVVSRKRKEDRWAKLVPERLYGTGEQQERTLAGTAVQADEAHPEGELLDLLKDALLAGFAGCTAEDWVLLELAHRDGLQRKELAQIWGHCQPSRVTNDLDRIERGVARRTLDYVREADPWLVLQWEDFAALCPVLNDGAPVDADLHEAELSPQRHKERKG